MSHISEFTPRNLEVLYEGFNSDEGVEVTHLHFFTIVRFDTISWELERRPSRVSQRIDHETLAGYRASRLSKRTIHHEKFFDTRTGVILGDSQAQAARGASRLGVEMFVKGDMGEALRFITLASENAEEAEAKINRQLLQAMTLVVEAERDLRELRHDEYIEKMKSAYGECPNATIKSIIGDRRNCQAERFSGLAEEHFTERRFEEAAKFHQLAFRLATEEYPKKDEFEAVMQMNQLQ